LRFKKSAFGWDKSLTILDCNLLGCRRVYAKELVMDYGYLGEAPA
jgi:hypothetical protein